MVAVWLPSPAAMLPPSDLRSPTLLRAAAHHPHQYLLASSPMSPVSPMSPDFSTHPLYTAPPPHLSSHLSTPVHPPKPLPTRPAPVATTPPSRHVPPPTSPTTPAPPRAAQKKVFPCPFPGCPQTSSNKGNLSKHIATRHEHRKDYHCPVPGCTKKFAKKFNMLRHLCSSSVHRRDARKADRLVAKSPRRVQRRGGKWTSDELDTANFLAMQCQSPTTSSTSLL